MDNLKIVVKSCAAVFFLGIFAALGIRMTELAWPNQERTVRIVHYLCAENDEGDVSCGKITDADIAKKILTR